MLHRATARPGVRKGGDDAPKAGSGRCRWGNRAKISRFWGRDGRQRPFFVCGIEFVSGTALDTRESWLRETLEGLGYELVDLESSRGGLLRIFIDSPRGISVEDCARVSNHLTRAFAVEEIEYERLEVSSPGLDRPLKRAEDFVRFAGQKASLRLKLPREGRRRFEGTLAGIQDGSVMLDVEGNKQAFALADIDRARLVPDV